MNIFIIFLNYCITHSGIYDCEIFIILSHLILAKSLIQNLLDMYLKCSRCFTIRMVDDQTVVNLLFKLSLLLQLLHGLGIENTIADRLSS